ncbi:unnamed protein product [Phytophthora lilii]|uniref:Unnamed protein product n=1 Tax=Phytophthora lilii TaxID=2077276 RepID=A0A9W6WPY3_9STRA|nr:unnamed protein product [Phytophthora lilii]
MSAEQEHADERPKRSWNSSTKLAQPRRAKPVVTRTRERQAKDGPGQGGAGRARPEGRTQLPRTTRNNGHRGEELVDGNDNEQQTLTRELLERAVSTAFGGLLQDSTLDATAFPDVNDSHSSEVSSVHGKENVRRRRVCRCSQQMLTLFMPHYRHLQ